MRRGGFDRCGAVVLACVLSGALLLRLGALAATPHLALASDPADYDRHARSIAAGHGYPSSHKVSAGGPSAFRPPGFPALVAVAYKVSGNEVEAARVAQALVGTVVVALIALIALMLFGPTVALVAGAMAAVFPPLVIDGMTLLSEPLFVAFELAAVVAALRWRVAHGPWWPAGAGALLGLAMLTRSEGVLLLLPLAVAVRGEGSWRTLASYRAPVVLVAGAMIVVAPWTIRNAVEMDAFVPVSDQDGYTLAGTYNATSRADDGIWIPANRDPDYARLLAQNRRLDEVQMGDKLRAEAWRFARDHPGYLPNVALHNTLRLFNLGGPGYERTVAAGDYGLEGRGWGWLMTYGLLPFLLLAVVGATTVAARGAPRWVWVIPVLLLSIVMVVATNRLRAPIDPFIIMLAALGLVAAARRWRRPAAPGHS